MFKLMAPLFTIALIYLLGILRIIPDLWLISLLAILYSMDFIYYMLNIKVKIHPKILTAKNQLYINNFRWQNKIALTILLIITTIISIYDYKIGNVNDIQHYIVMLFIIITYFNLSVAMQTKFVVLYESYRRITNDKK